MTHTEVHKRQQSEWNPEMIPAASGAVLGCCGEGCRPLATGPFDSTMSMRMKVCDLTGRGAKLYTHRRRSGRSLLSEGCRERQAQNGRLYSILEFLMSNDFHPVSSYQMPTISCSALQVPSAKLFKTHTEVKQACIIIYSDLERVV